MRGLLQVQDGVKTNKENALKSLQRAPGIGPSLSTDLYDLGMRSLEELTGADPERLYLKLCALRGRPVDRCVLYAFRCAVYYASVKRPDPSLLKWWNWKDGKKRGKKERQ